MLTAVNGQNRDDGQVGRRQVKTFTVHLRAN